MVIGANGLVWLTERSPEGSGVESLQPLSHPVQLSKTSNPHYLPAAQSLVGTNRAVARMGCDLT